MVARDALDAGGPPLQQAVALHLLAALVAASSAVAAPAAAAAPGGAYGGAASAAAAPGGALLAALYHHAVPQALMQGLANVPQALLVTASRASRRGADRRHPPLVSVLFACLHVCRHQSWYYSLGKSSVACVRAAACRAGVLVLQAQLALLLAMVQAGAHPKARQLSAQALFALQPLQYLVGCRALDMEPEDPGSTAAMRLRGPEHMLDSVRCDERALAHGLQGHTQPVRRAKLSPTQGGRACKTCFVVVVLWLGCGGRRHRLQHLIPPVLRLVLGLVAALPESSTVRLEARMFVGAHYRAIDRCAQCACGLLLESCGSTTPLARQLEHISRAAWQPCARQSDIGSRAQGRAKRAQRGAAEGGLAFGAGVAVCTCRILREAASTEVGEWAPGEDELEQVRRRELVLGSPCALGEPAAAKDGSASQIQPYSAAGRGRGAGCGSCAGRQRLPDPAVRQRARQRRRRRWLRCFGARHCAVQAELATSLLCRLVPVWQELGPMHAEGLRAALFRVATAFCCLDVKSASPIVRWELALGGVKLAFWRGKECLAHLQVGARPGGGRVRLAFWRGKECLAHRRVGAHPGGGRVRLAFWRGKECLAHRRVGARLRDDRTCFLEESRRSSALHPSSDGPGSAAARADLRDCVLTRMCAVRPHCVALLRSLHSAEPSASAARLLGAARAGAAAAAPGAAALALAAGHATAALAAVAAGAGAGNNRAALLQRATRVASLRAALARYLRDLVAHSPVPSSSSAAAAAGARCSRPAVCPSMGHDGGAQQAVVAACATRGPHERVRVVRPCRRHERRAVPVHGHGGATRGGPVPVPAHAAADPRHGGAGLPGRRRRAGGAGGPARPAQASVHTSCLGLPVLESRMRLSPGAESC